MRVLIVDDSGAMRTTLRRALGRLERWSDAAIVEAGDGQQALAAVRSTPPDLVLTDWNMPSMSGLELLRALRREGDGPRIGVITSEATPEVRSLAIANGASFVLAKPFTRVALERALATVLER